MSRALVRHPTCSGCAAAKEPWYRRKSPAKEPYCRQSALLRSPTTAKEPCERARLTRAKPGVALIHGQIPPECGLLTSLVRLLLNDNQLTEIPLSFGLATNLHEVDLQNNGEWQTPVRPHPTLDTPHPTP